MFGSLFFIFSFFIHSLATYSYDDEDNICITWGNLYFDSVPPEQSNSLSFCKHHHESTCCNKSHSDILLHSLYPYVTSAESQEIGFSQDCVQMTATVLCAGCDPDLGTRSLLGLCRSLCDKWYQTCKYQLFQRTGAGIGILLPCQEDSLVCSKLYQMVNNGTSLCSDEFSWDILDDVTKNEIEIEKDILKYELNNYEYEYISDLCYDGRDSTFAVSRDNHKSSGKDKTSQKKEKNDKNNDKKKTTKKKTKNKSKKNKKKKKKKEKSPNSSVDKIETYAFYSLIILALLGVILLRRKVILSFLAYVFGFFNLTELFTRIGVRKKTKLDVLRNKARIDKLENLHKTNAKNIKGKDKKKK